MKTKKRLPCVRKVTWELANLVCQAQKVIALCSKLNRHVQMKIAERGMSNLDHRNSEWCSKLVPKMTWSMSRRSDEWLRVMKMVSDIRWRACVVTMRRLNGYKVIEIRWLSGIESIVSERHTLTFQWRDFRICVGILEPGQQFEQEHSGCVGDDLFDISEDHSCSSQAWSVRWRWQLFWWCEGQGMDEYSEEHGCDGSRI